MTSQQMTAQAQNPTDDMPTSSSSLVTRLLSTEADVATSIARIALGAVMFPHAAQKVFGWFGGSGFGGTVGFFESIGVNAVVATVVIGAELFASIALLLGAGSRIAALAIAGVMIGAIAKVHGSNGFFMNWYGTQPGEGFEFHLLALGLAALIAIRGGGAFSIDRILDNQRRAA